MCVRPIEYYLSKNCTYYYVDRKLYKLNIYFYVYILSLKHPLRNIKLCTIFRCGYYFSFVN